MQLRFSTVFSTTFFVFLFFTLAATEVSPKTSFDGFGPCPAPSAPTGLTVTGVTTTSISIAWNGADMYYNQIEVTDTDASITYPTQQADFVSFAVITGLIEGHHHTIDLRRATCSGGSYSSKSSTSTSTAIIIVEKIVAIASHCDPSTLYPPAVGPGNIEFVEVCVSPTTVTGSAPPYTVTNPYVGKFTKGNATAVEYALIYKNTNNEVWANIITPPDPVTHISYKFVKNSNGSAECKKLFIDPGTGETISVTLFSVNLLVISTENADVVISFPMNGNHSYCNAANCNGGRSSGKQFQLNIGNTARSEQLLNEEILEQAITPPAPNPFTQSTTLRYELTAPTQVSVQLFDAIGNLVQTVQPATQLSEGEYTATIQGANLPNGTYFAVVQKGSERQVFPLVRQE